MSSAIQHPIDDTLDLIGLSHHTYRAVPTADEHALRSILAALKKETSR